MEPVKGKKYIQSVERALNLLTYIADNGSARLSEISRWSGLKTSTVAGLLQTLQHTGFLAHKSGSSDYCLGLNSLKLGLCFNQTADLSATIHTLLTELVEDINETAYFEIKIGQRYYYLDVVLSKQPLKVVPDDEHFITLPDNSAVAKVYHSAAKNLLYATDLEEVTAGLNCFAVPFRSGPNLLGCVALSGPSSRFTAAKMPQTYERYCAIMRKLKLEANL